MGKTVLCAVTVLLFALPLAAAEDKKLGVSLDLTYTSKWLSKGIEAYGQQGGSSRRSTSTSGARASELK